MARSKRIRRTEPAGDFTDQLRAGDGWRDTAVVRMADETGVTAARSTRLCDRIGQLLRDDWVSLRGAEALRRYEDAYCASSLDHARSCLDRTPVGHTEGGTPPHVSLARAEFSRLAMACPMMQLTYVHAVLFDPDRRNAMDIADDMISGARATRRTLAKHYVGQVSECLVVAIDAR